MTVDKASITDPAANTVHTYGTFTDGIRFYDHRPGQGRHQGLRLHAAEGGRGQREHAARRRPVPDPAQRQMDESRSEHRQMVGRGRPRMPPACSSPTRTMTGRSTTGTTRAGASSVPGARLRRDTVRNQEPAGYASYAKPTFTVTIDDAGTSIQYRGTGTVPNLTSRLDNNTVEVERREPDPTAQAGGVLAFAFWLACAMPLFAIGGTSRARRAQPPRRADARTTETPRPSDMQGARNNPDHAVSAPPPSFSFMVLLARRKGFVRVLAHPSRTVKGRGRKKHTCTHG